MNLDQITNELKNQADKMNLIDNNVKFNLQMYWAVLAVVVAVLALAIFFLVKQFISSTFKAELDKKFEELKQNMDTKIEEATDELKRTKADKSEALKCENGIWTPIIQGIDTRGKNRYGYQLGSYNRQGDLVNINAHILLSHKDSNMSGSIYIGGLPFVNNNNITISCAIGFCASIETKGQIVANIIPNDNRIALNYLIDKHRSESVNPEDISNNFAIILSATYRIE